MRHVADLGVGGHGGGRGKGPARAAHSLIPDAGDHSLLPPVDLGRQVLQSDLSPRYREDGVRMELPRVQVTAGVGLDKLLPGGKVILMISDTETIHLVRSANLVTPSLQL